MEETGTRQSEALQIFRSEQISADGADYRSEENATSSKPFEPRAENVLF